MPTYEYRCQFCDLIVTVIRSMKDDSEEKCDNCNAPMLKQFGSPAVTFNGTGFYSTDKKSK